MARVHASMVAVLSFTSLALPAWAGLAKGSAFPALSLTDDRGEQVTIDPDAEKDSFSEKKVLLWWYPKADTPGCTKEGKTFQDLNQAYSVKGVQVVGVSADSVADNRHFSDKMGFKYPLLSDTSRSIPEALGVTSRRWAVMIREDRAVEQFWPDIDDPEMFPVQPLSWIAQQEWSGQTEL